MKREKEPSNDIMAVMNVESAPVVVAMAICDGIGEATAPVTSSIDSNVNNASSSSAPFKKSIDRELRQPFPVKVYEMLENAGKNQFSHIVSWNSTGTGFMVHDKDYFTKDIVPHYFNLTKYKSFQRQLSLYGFQRVTVGPNKGLRYHEKLRRGKIELVRQMKPVGYKPRNLTRLLEQKNQKEHKLLGRATNIVTTTTTTVIKTTTTSTALVTSDPSKNDTNTIPAVTDNIVDSIAPRDVNCMNVLSKSPISGNFATSIPPVVSSNSLIKQEDNDDTTNESKKKHEIKKYSQLHSISPEESCHSRIHLPSNRGFGVPARHACSRVRDTRLLNIEQQNLDQSESQVEPEIVTFEGMYFYLMSPTRELCINVKLKLLEEFNPASSLLRLASKYVKSQTGNVSTMLPETIPISIDAVQNDKPSLLEPFTDILKTADKMSTASTTTTVKTVGTNSPAHKPICNTARSLLSSTKSDTAVENRSMDALDVHSINTAKRI